MYLEEGVVTASCKLAGQLDVTVQPVLDGETEAGENRCLRLRPPPPEHLQKGHSGCAHPMDTHAQKSSTVLNLVIRRRFACHILLLSFLKNHSAHLGREGEEMGCSIMLETPSSPSTPLPELGEAVHGQASHTCSAGGACPGSLPGAALAAEPSAGVAPVASAEEGGTAPKSPMTTPAGSLQPPSCLPHWAPRGLAGLSVFYSLPGPQGKHPPAPL